MNAFKKCKPTFEEVQSLHSPEYEHLTSVSRCLHIDDLQQSIAAQMLVPQWIRNSKALRNVKVLWFAPAQPMDEHNFYGNVSFVIDWENVVSTFGPMLYLIDQAIYNDRGFTRVLLTKNNYGLEGVQLDECGSPLIEQNGSYHHVVRCCCKKRPGPHELQIGIEVSDEEAKWLFSNCSLIANNHSFVNVPSRGQFRAPDGKLKKFEPYRCFKYNTALNSACPTALSLEETETLLSSLDIRLGSAFNNAAGDSLQFRGQQTASIAGTDFHRPTHFSLSMNDINNLVRSIRELVTVQSSIHGEQGGTAGTNPNDYSIHIPTEVNATSSPTAPAVSSGTDESNIEFESRNVESVGQDCDTIPINPNDDLNVSTGGSGAKRNGFVLCGIVLVIALIVYFTKFM